MEHVRQHGHLLLRSAIPDALLTPLHVKRLRTYLKRNRRTEPIFNTTSKSRWQLVVSPRTDKDLHRAILRLADHIPLSENHIIGVCSVLHSDPNCSVQYKHRDFPVYKFGDDHPSFPVGVLIALETGTRLNIYEPEPSVVEMDKGDVLIFHGGLLHAGAAYERSNTRIHMYCDLQGDPAATGRHTYDRETLRTNHQYNTRFKCLHRD